MNVVGYFIQALIHYHFVVALWRTKTPESQHVRHWEIIADDLKEAGWNCGCIASADDKGRQFWVAAAEQEDAGRFIVRANEKLTAFMELESAVKTK